MCFDTDRFVDKELASQLTCVICQGILCCPQLNETQPISKQEASNANGREGGHKFCEKCILDWLEHDKSCPECRSALDVNTLQPLDRILSNVLQGMKIRCKNYSLGCSFTDKLELIQKHEINCSFEKKTCKICGSTLDKSSADHSDSDCKMKLLSLIKSKDEDIETKDDYIEILTIEIQQLNAEKTNITESFEVKIKELEETIMKLKEELNNANGLQVKPQTAKRRVPNPSVKRLEKIPEIVELCRSKENNYEKVKELVEQKNADVNYKDKEGYSSLILASWNGHLDIAKFLIENNANVNDQANNGWSALIWACWSGHYKIAELLIENKANINLKAHNGWTALIWASRNGYLKLVKFLVENGAIINDKGNTSTALYNASKRNHQTIVKYLTSKGAL